jgi:DNA polymerase
MVLLGATAAQAILGSAFRVTVDHGKLLEPERPGGPRRLATLHPSAILRARTPEDREKMRRTLVSDLTVAAGSLSDRPGARTA